MEGSPRSAVHLVLRISRNPHRYVVQAGEYQVKSLGKQKKTTE